MSEFKIPYLFRAIPDEFLTDDFIDDPTMMRLIRYIMKRISPNPNIVTFKNNGKFRKIELQPFEFVFGREACAKEANISEKNARNKMGQLVELGFVEKQASRSASTFSVYRIVTTAFRQNLGQQMGQQLGQQMGQQVGHNLEKEKEREKEEYIPSASPSEKIVGLDFVNENFEQSSFQVNPSQVMESQSKHNVYYSTTNSEESETKQNKTSDKKTKNKQKQEKEQIQKIAFRENVFLTQVEHDKLLSEHGQIALEWMLNKLHHSKNAYGYKYKSDYSAIHSWVIDAYSKSKSTTNNSNSNISDLRRVRDINGNYIKNPHEGSF